jgi:hypothetical protein
MPFNTDTRKILLEYVQSLPNKKNHNTPSSLGDVKKLSGDKSKTGYQLDIKGQLSDEGLAGNTPVDVTGETSGEEKVTGEEDAETIDLSGVSTEALLKELLNRQGQMR